MTYFGQEIASVIFLDITERLAFMFGDPVMKDEFVPEDVSWSQASIRFTGDMEGSLTLTVPHMLCFEIAANILGEEIGDLQDIMISEDALKEMLNVVTGHVVPGLQGEDQYFTLSIPEYSVLPPAEASDLKHDPGSICFNLDGSPVLLALHVRESGAE